VYVARYDKDRLLAAAAINESLSLEEEFNKFLSLLLLATYWEEPGGLFERFREYAVILGRRLGRCPPKWIIFHTIWTGDEAPGLPFFRMPPLPDGLYYDSEVQGELDYGMKKMGECLTRFCEPIGTASSEEQLQRRLKFVQNPVSVESSARIHGKEQQESGERQEREESKETCQAKGKQKEEVLGRNFSRSFPSGKFKQGVHGQHARWEPKHREPQNTERNDGSSDRVCGPGHDQTG
jgi:hypothetical protein